MATSIPLSKASQVIMGQSPPGDTYNEEGVGLPLLNGPTEFGPTHPECSLFTTDTRRECEPGDLIFCVRGSTTGRMNWADKKYSLGRGVCAFRARSQAETRFVRYCIEDKLHALLQLAGGGTFPNLTKETIESFEIPWPDDRVRIAGILSAYDELIENSQRRIKILESMARGLYREWFVHFRFPGHESVPRVKSPLGEIPKGWGICSLGEFVQFKSGFAFKSGTFTADGEYRLVTIKNVQDGSFNPESDSRMSELPANLPPYCVLKDGEILLSLTGNVGRVCLVYDGPFLLNQRVSKLAPVESFDWAMTYCMFREPEMRVKLEQLSNGVAQQNLSPVLASKMEFVRPPRELRLRFAVLAEPMVQRIVQLYSTIQNLRRTRDLLLPRLLSGQIDVEAIGL